MNVINAIERMVKMRSLSHLFLWRGFLLLYMSHFLRNDVQYLIGLSEVGKHLKLDEGEWKLY